jgi:hypothetical protein
LSLTGRWKFDTFERFAQKTPVDAVKRQTGERSKFEDTLA